jgi:hypothetical protein
MKEDLDLRIKQIEEYIAFGKQLESEVDSDYAKNVIRDSIKTLGILRKSYLERISLEKTLVSDKEPSLGKKIKMAHNEEFGRARVTNKLSTEFYLNGELIDKALQRPEVILYTLLEVIRDKYAK